MPEYFSDAEDIVIEYFGSRGLPYAVVAKFLELKCPGRNVPLEKSQLKLRLRHLTKGSDSRGVIEDSDFNGEMKIDTPSLISIGPGEQAILDKVS